MALNAIILGGLCGACLAANALGMGWVNWWQAVLLYSAAGSIFSLMMITEQAMASEKTGS